MRLKERPKKKNHNYNRIEIKTRKKKTGMVEYETESRMIGDNHVRFGGRRYDAS